MVSTFWTARILRTMRPLTFWTKLLLLPCSVMQRKSPPPSSGRIPETRSSRNWSRWTRHPLRNLSRSPFLWPSVKPSAAVPPLRKRRDFKPFTPKPRTPAVTSLRARLSSPLYFSNRKCFTAPSWAKGIPMSLAESDSVPAKSHTLSLIHSTTSPSGNFSMPPRKVISLQTNRLRNLLPSG